MKDHTIITQQSIIVQLVAIEVKIRKIGDSIYTVDNCRLTFLIKLNSFSNK